MVIDIFSHIIPSKYSAVLNKMAADGKIPPFNKTIQNEFQIRGISDIDARLELMDENPDVKEVLSVTGPFLETIVGPEDGAALARLANDELAEIVAKYPERFVAGVAFLAYSNIDAALLEIDRCINNLKFRGIQIGTDVNGKPLDSPELMPVYAKMESYDLPIFIHPSKNCFAPDYPGEADSRYNLVSTVGWPHATTMAMLRLVHGGILEKYPKLKLITHHAGGTVPYLAKRIEFSDQHKLPKPLTDYLRLFYADTAVQGNIPNLRCAYAFFGASNIVFGTDFPFGNQNVMRGLQAIREMNISAAEKKRILEENARRVLKIK